MKISKKTNICRLVVLCAFGFVLHNVTAQKSIKIHRATEIIKIDGEATEAIWQQHLVAGNFIQTLPEAGKSSKQKTDIAILFDDSYLYVLGVLYVDDKNEISSQLTARDDVGNADVFGIQIDPFGEAREGYDFSVTAAGVQSDQKITPTDTYANYNVVWQSKVKLYATKWIVEMKIPFNSIRFPKEDLSNFKINFQRITNALNEDAYWNPIRLDVDGYLNQLGKLNGLNSIVPPLNLSFNPFVSVVTEKSPTGTKNITFNGGLDVKYVHKNAYTLDVSLIPDFSQAPSDDQIFNLSPFEVKFNENRQFFVEGTEIFDKGGYLYTRRIGGAPISKDNIHLPEDEEVKENPVTSNIINLLKFTGKSKNGLSIGVLNGITAESEAEIKNINTNTTRKVVTNPLTNYNAIVLDKALKNNSSLTFINNSVLRSGAIYDANLTALLYRYYNKNRTYSMYFKKALSQKYFSNTEDEFGHEYYGYAGKVSGKWRGGASIKLLDDKFDSNDFGYLSRNNELRFKGDLSYTNNKPKKIFSRYQVFLDHQQRYYYSLMKQEQTYYKLGTYGVFKKNNHTFFAEFRYLAKGKNFFEARTKDRHFNVPAQAETFLEYQTNSNKNISLSAYMVLVKYYNSDVFTNEFITGYGLRARVGQHFSLYFSQALEDKPNGVGFIKNEENDIVFGSRKVKELNNAITLNYAVNSTLNVNMRLRHYWITVDYNNQFTLKNNGDFMTNNFSINPDDYDDNFNQFNIDVLAKWQFAPASEVSLACKLGSNYYNAAVNSNYGTNLKRVLEENNSTTVSLKMTYFLDANILKKRR
ncbi:carbohydrate binding protein with CBM9 domain [Cellulophaga sp. RHA_52]|uniref:DUF5916 domain-containing protein n=1 Tax=Cellulophaga sp. RHA_52 TaxID=1250036 RepID=UPI001199B981|nr:DUF5916 domain-containing protein [Cellulophaga sp. RHA_52]TVZ10505.1 carbohydrate binding protein with CBM9 domain [Cellulophaga sp. RHA_52]